MSSLSFRQSDLWKVPRSFSSHSSPSKLVLSTCSRPAGKDPPQPPVWLFSSQLPKPRLPQQFPRVLLCHPGCQNWAHLLGKEVKGRVMVGCHTMPYSWPAGPLWIQKSLPAVCPALLAWGLGDKHFFFLGELTTIKDHYGNGQRFIQGAVGMPRMQALTQTRV